MIWEKYKNRYYIAGTGHRPQSYPGGYSSIDENTATMRKAISEEIDKLDEKDLSIISGMAQGFDWALAQVAIEKDIPLICAVPCRGQENKWPKPTQDAYKEIIAKAVHVEYISEYYAPWVMQKRNIWMTDNCDLLLACWNRGKSGGTFNCIKYAMKNEVKISNLYSQCGFS